MDLFHKDSLRETELENQGSTVSPAITMSPDVVIFLNILDKHIQELTTEMLNSTVSPTETPRYYASMDLTKGHLERIKREVVELNTI